MENAQSLIQLYDAGFYFCLALGIASLLSGVFMFFKFEIPTIFAIRTGRKQRVSVEKRKKENARTGTLRQDIDLDFQTAPLTKTSEVNQTVLLGKSMGLTSPIFKRVESNVVPGFKFLITESEIVIHTNEILDC